MSLLSFFLLMTSSLARIIALIMLMESIRFVFYSRTSGLRRSSGVLCAFIIIIFLIGLSVLCNIVEITYYLGI